ncbi:polysaccharide biosynthesis/export family protein [Methylorubrum rhodesianum]|uniref:polysaccharide biosynthesis/export family protein n=2 Tax=Methylorubrum TaxID=2282523 RepID=UPI001AEECB27|nr:polysaccharide biosynthesis/export family protein [Methylorubrum rhodesianum]
MGSAPEGRRATHFRSRCHSDERGPTMAGRYLGLFCATLRACLVLCAGPTSARADDYRLKLGDTLTFSVPSLNIERKTTIGPDGKMAIPLMGSIDARNKTLEELQAIVKQTLPTKVYSQRLSDGREVGTVIAADEISLFVSEFRPVYASGDVLSPGERAFRPGMIVEQLLSMVGGLSLTQMRLENPYLGYADLRADYDAVWNDVVRLRARIDWLRRTLDLPVAAPDTTALKSPLPPALVKTIKDLQDSELNARAQRYAKERDDLERMITSSRNRITVVEKQREKEEEGARFDASEEQRINELVRQGAAAANRATEIRRLSLLSATRSLQVQVQAEAERKSYAEFIRQAGVLERDYRSALNTELQSVSTDYTKAQSRRESVWEKMLYTGATKLSLANGEAQQVKLVINRDTGSGWQPIDAEPSTELQPGDVVHVQIKLGQPYGSQ